MKFKTKLKTTASLVDLTPLVDVIFLLLIFFIITSNILPLKSLNIQNPSIPQTSDSLISQILVIMDKDSVLYVGSKKDIHDFSTVKDALEKEILKFQEKGNDNPTIVLNIDKRISYDLFLKLFSKVRELNKPLKLSYQLENDARL